MTRQPGIDESGQIVRAQAPASGVSVPAHLGVGADLVHTLDYVVMLQVMFNLASGMQSTPMTVWKQLQARGIRSAKNAKTLVGRDAVYESFARLVDAGYLLRRQLPHPELPGRKGPVVYETFDNPAWNPEWQARQAGTDPLTEAEKKPQVGTLPGTPDPVTPEAGKTAGRNASRNAGSGNDGSGVPGSVNRAVPAGRDASGVPGSGIALPPHPPEGVDTSSPYPLNRAKSGVPSQMEGEGGFPLEDIRSAERLLQLLKEPWHAGRQTAHKCAPRLLAVMRDQGWPAIGKLSDRDRQLLERELTKNPEGVTRPSHVLPKRIADLPLYEVVSKSRAASRTMPAEGMCTKHPAFRDGDCPPCIQEQRQQAQRGPSKPSGLAGEGASLLARLRAAQQDPPAQGD